MTTRALVYVRISKDLAGDHLGVDRQESVCRRLAADRGLEVIRVLVDNDVSAYRRAPRPAFEELVEALKGSEVEAVVVYHVDRLYRRMADLERLVEIVEVTGAEIHTVAAGDVDLSSASGRMVARMLGAAAQHESERIGERSKVKNDELASRGRPPGGRAPYGYRWDRSVSADGSVVRGYSVNEAEAEALRFMARRVLEGGSLLATARELDKAGATTREGRPWHHATVRAVLINPAVAGLRVHRREVAGPGEWKPILDRSTWEQLRFVLADPLRKRTRGARRYLLGGGLVVNAAGDHLNGMRDRAGRPTYATRSPAKPMLSIEASKLEAFVVEAVLSTLDDASLPPAEEPAAGGDDVGALEAELAEIAELRGRGVISLAEWLAAREPLQRRIEEARRSLSGPHRAAKWLDEPGAVRRAWPTLDVASQREIIAAVVDAVVVSPAGSRGRWMPLADRIQILWKA